MNLLKRLANSAAVAALIGWIFAHMSFVIPAKRLRESETLLAFYHPRPAYPFHVILTPKKDIRTFADLSPADPFLAELVSAAQGLVEEYPPGLLAADRQRRREPGFPAPAFSFDIRRIAASRKVHPAKG